MKDGTWQRISPAAKNLIQGLLKFDPAQRMHLEDVLQSPWLSRKSLQASTDPALMSEVLQNLQQFSNTSRFFSICVASVARQLDHHRLQDIHKVFLEMDTNGDGVLELHEFRDGFNRIFGKESQQVQDLEKVFMSLDLDGSGTIDYTEFCAAGIGERTIFEEDVLWTAFKAFDVQEDDGKLSKDEIKQVLLSGRLSEAWAQELCEEILEQFDEDGDGSLDFQEWLRLMRESASRPRQDELDRSLHEGAFDLLAKRHYEFGAPSKMSRETTAESMASGSMDVRRSDSEGSSIQRSLLRLMQPFRSWPCIGISDP